MSGRWPAWSLAASGWRECKLSLGPDEQARRLAPSAMFDIESKPSSKKERCVPNPATTTTIFRSSESDDDDFF
jgi:hypothetical protein